ncbi:MAG: patatin-like phospholipase family protein [Actinomycetota bacterium]
MSDRTLRLDLPPLHDWPRPLAFALSGGGAFGSVHVGMVQALAEHGVRPDLVVGTSVGSLNGALLAHEPDDAGEQLAAIWTEMSRATVFGHGWIRAMRNFARRRTLSGFDQLASLIDSMLPVEHFDELALPFAAVATDAVSGEPELLRDGLIKPALLASSAIPRVFPPVTVDGRQYIDGGISANLPIRQAIAFGARSVVALDAAPQVPPQAPTGLATGAFHLATLMVRNQRAHAVDDLASRYPILVLPSVTPHDIGSFNFDRTAELIAASRRASARTLSSVSATASI